MKRFLVVVVAVGVLAGAGTEASAVSRPTDSGSGRATMDAGLAATIDRAAPAEQIAAVAVLREQLPTSSATLPRQRRARPAALERLLKDVAAHSQADLLMLLSQHHDSGAVSSITPLWIVNAVSVRATPAVLRELAARPDVLQLLPERQISAPPPTAAVPSATTNIDLVNAPALWDLGWQGQGVVVANLDTGVDASHPDLAGRWRGGTNSWYDPNGEHPTTPTDISGHGTAVMGVMVGGSASGTAIGMAPAASWIAVKIFNDHGVATSTTIHLGMQWLLDPDGNPNTQDAPDVVNNSWTMSAAGCNLEFQSDLAALRSAGILPVFSAGNFGPTPGTVLSPANNPAAFPVGSTDNADVVDPSSSRGPSACGSAVTPAMTAPGVGIHTTDLFGLYTDASGTSVAAPHVAGALALLLSAFPDTSADRQAAALQAGSVDLGPPGGDSDYGYGRLDVAASYQWLASSPDYTITVAPTAATVNAGGSKQVSVTIDAVGGFAGLVTLSAAGLPANVGTASVTPPTLAGSGTAQLSIVTVASAPGGTFPVTVTATAGSVSHSAVFNLTVVPKGFTLSATPNSLTLARGKSGKYTLTITRTGGFTGAVTLKLTGLPAGATKSFMPNPVPNGVSTATLTVKPTATTPKGTYYMTVTGTSNGKVRTVVVTLVVI